MSTARAIIILIWTAVLLVAAIWAPVLLLLPVIRGPLIYRAARHLWTRYQGPALPNMDA